MGTNLHQLLRSLCLDTDWKYAIFWKLQHCARMYGLCFHFQIYLCDDVSLLVLKLFVTCFYFLSNFHVC